MADENIQYTEGEDPQYQPFHLYQAVMLPIVNVSLRNIGQT